MIRYKGIATLEVLEEAKNYNRWIADTISPFITSPALEIGAGTGNLTKFFINNKKLLVTDKDRGLVTKLQKKFHQHTHISVSILDIEKKPKEQMKASLNSIYAINVVEHIASDEKAFKHMHYLLKRKGKVILLVPAKKFAYTKLDKALGHYRRYEKNELNDKLVNAGFVIEHIQFFNMVGLLSWFVRDKVNDGSISLQPYHVTLFDKIVPMLRKIEQKISIPAGISLIVVARKK